MTFQIIIKGEEEQRRKLKGKNVSELAKNMESIGWPTEMPNEEMRDRIKHAEKRSGRSLQASDCMEIAKEVGIRPKHERIRQIAQKQGLEYFETGYPDPNEHGDLVHRK